MFNFIFRFFRSRYYKNRILISFLNCADDAYIKAFQYKLLGDFAKYSVADVYFEVQRRIIYRNNRIWGTEDLRTRKWDIISIKNNEIVVRKELKFKTVKIGNIFVPLGNDCVEYWVVIFNGKNYKIKEIQFNG